VLAVTLHDCLLRIGGGAHRAAQRMLKLTMLTVSTVICRCTNYKYCLWGAGILGIFLANEQQLAVKLSKVGG
jgi:hypothetical protein